MAFEQHPEGTPEPLPMRLLSDKELAERLKMVEEDLKELEFEALADGSMTPDDFHEIALDSARDGFIRELREQIQESEFDAVESGEVPLEDIAEVTEVLGSAIDVIEEHVQSGQADDILRRHNPQFPA